LTPKKTKYSTKQSVKEDNFASTSFPQNSFLPTLCSGENVNFSVDCGGKCSDEKINNIIQTKQKRGRKPKGGKIKTKEPDDKKNTKVITNIILHLKCFTSDLNNFNSNINKLSINLLEYNPTIPPDIMTYNNTSFICSEKKNDYVNNLYPYENNDITYNPNKQNNFTNCKTIEKEVINKPAYQP